MALILFQSTIILPRSGLSVRWGRANARGKEPCPGSSLHSCRRGRSYWEDSGGQLTVSVAGRCRDIGAPVLTLLLLSTTSCLSPLCWPRESSLKEGIHSGYWMCFDIAWRYWLVALRSISPHTLRSASSCFKTWENHKENWQCHSCSVISVIQPAAALLTKTVHSAALPSLLFSLCL